jgi:hypothetical protein
LSSGFTWLWHRTPEQRRPQLRCIPPRNHRSLRARKVWVMQSLFYLRCIFCHLSPLFEVCQRSSV